MTDPADVGWDVIAGFEKRGGLLAKECGLILEAEKGKKQILPRTPGRKEAGSAVSVIPAPWGCIVFWLLTLTIIRKQIGVVLSLCLCGSLLQLLWELCRNIWGLKIRSQGNNLSTFVREGKGRAGVQESEESAPWPRSLRCRDRIVSHGTYNWTHLNRMQCLLPWLSRVSPGWCPQLPLLMSLAQHTGSCDSLAFAAFSVFIYCCSFSHQNRAGFRFRATGVPFERSSSPSWLLVACWVSALAIFPFQGPCRTPFSVTFTCFISL